VALEVEKLLAGDVAHLLQLEGAEVLLAGLEARDVVELAADVYGDALVPACPVRLAPLLPVFAHPRLLVVGLPSARPRAPGGFETRPYRGYCPAASGHNL
jgi:hypothetical protein